MPVPRLPKTPSNPSHRFRTIVRTVLITLVIVTVALWALTRIGAVRRRIVKDLQPAHVWPKPAEFRLRQVLLADRNQALAQGDLKRAASIHADLSQEALMRAAATQRAWMNKQDPATNLFPQSDVAPHWTYRNTGADLFGFLLQSGMELNPQSMPRLLATLKTEAEISPPGTLCQDVETHTKKPLKQDHGQRIFSSSEYVKDGLLSVYERYGVSPISARMMQVLDAVVADSQQSSSFGMLPGQGSEENGNVLQACGRLSFSAGRPEYAEMAARITDAVITEMLPRSNGLPVAQFDYAAKKVIASDVRLRDHGNEIIPGLAEAYALAVARSNEPQWKERADRWAEPLAAMYEKLIAHGVSPGGLLISRLDPTSLKASDRINDNWGYILNGYLLYAQAARRQGKIAPERLAALEAKVDRVADATAKKHGLPWQGEEMDGYADTIESALYIAAHRQETQYLLLDWVDDEIELMFSCQRDDGLVTDGYLDGNFIRTAMMYADQKSGGWKVDPWRADVRVGFAKDDAGKAAIVVRAGSAYHGVLRAEQPRHETIMKLPWDWPRLNSWPEWFVPTESMRVTNSEGLPSTPGIHDLLAGIPLNLAANGMSVIYFEGVGSTTK